MFKIIIFLLSYTIPFIFCIENSVSYLKIQLENPNDGRTIDLDYKLEKNSVARRFELLMHRHLLYPHEIQYLTWV